MKLYEITDMELMAQGAIKRFGKEIQAFANAPTQIYRGMKFTNDFVLLDGNKLNRSSANTNNYYTLFLDNDERWKAYPKRSKSFICTTDRDVAQGYGHVFFAIPLEHQSIGVCPAGDFWFSFNDNLISPNNFNEVISSLSFQANIDVSEKNYQDFVNDLGRIDKYISEHNEDIDSWIRNRLNKLNYNGSLFELFKNYYDPEKNGFSLSHVGSHIDSDVEVWMSGKVLFISRELWPEVEKLLSQGVQ